MSGTEFDPGKVLSDPIFGNPKARRCLCGADRTGPSAEAHDAACPANESIFSYDEKCEALARYFLQERPDSGGAIKALAQVIQDAIEDWLNYQLPAADGCEHDKTDLGHVHR